MGRSSSKHQTHPEEFTAPINMADYAGYEHGPRDGKDYGRPYPPEAPQMNKKHSCTDILCLLLFVVFLGAWGFVAYMGVKEGNIVKVIYPTDSQGNVCGQDNRLTGGLDMRHRNYLMLFDITQCFNPAVFVTGCLTPQICVKKCPDENYSPYGQTVSLGRLVDPSIKNKMRPFCSPAMDSLENKDKSVKELIKDHICPAWYLKSSPVLGRCFPDPMKGDVVVNAADTQDNVTVTKTKLDVAQNRLAGFLNIRELGERVFSDLVETWWMIGLALIGACILSFIWIVLMRLLAGFMVWLTILLVFVLVGGLLAYCSYRLYFAWIDGNEKTQQNILQVNFTPDYLDDVLKLRDTWLAFTIILGIFFVIILMIFIFLRQRILIAISLIKQGSKAVGQMFSTLFFPIVPFLLQLIVVGWFLIIALYLSSSGVAEYRVAIATPGNQESKIENGCLNATASCLNPETNMRKNYTTNDGCSKETFLQCTTNCGDAVATCNFVKYTKSNDISWMQAFNLFGLYWGIFFFSAFGEIVLAGVFADWYWTRDKKKGLRSCSLGRSMWNATIFHLGTIAFGSLILAIIRFIRVMLEWVEKKLKRFNNDLTKCLLCCCKCCLWCLEKFMRFINRNAYIMCAVKSTNFCRSAKDAFDLLMRNIVRVAVLDKVCDFLLFLGKIVIVIGIGILSYLGFGGYVPDLEVPALNYFFTPIVFIIIGSYLIASAFFGVYAMAVDTIFLCFLEDLERNNGEDRPYYMSKELKKILGKMERNAQHQVDFAPSAPYYHQRQ